MALTTAYQTLLIVLVGVLIVLVLIMDIVRWVRGSQFHWDKDRKPGEPEPVTWISKLLNHPYAVVGMQGGTEIASIGVVITDAIFITDLQTNFGSRYSSTVADVAYALFALSIFFFALEWYKRIRGGLFDCRPENMQNRNFTINMSRHRLGLFSIPYFIFDLYFTGMLVDHEVTSWFVFFKMTFTFLTLCYNLWTKCVTNEEVKNPDYTFVQHFGLIILAHMFFWQSTRLLRTIFCYYFVFKSAIDTMVILGYGYVLDIQLTYPVLFWFWSAMGTQCFALCTSAFLQFCSCEPPLADNAQAYFGVSYAIAHFFPTAFGAIIQVLWIPILFLTSDVALSDATLTAQTYLQISATISIAFLAICILRLVWLFVYFLLQQLGMCVQSEINNHGVRTPPAPVKPIVSPAAKTTLPMDSIATPSSSDHPSAPYQAYHPPQPIAAASVSAYPPYMPQNVSTYPPYLPPPAAATTPTAPYSSYAQPQSSVASPPPSSDHRVFCGECGRANKSTTKFCIQCGTKLEEL